jgi:hypothetical protein
MELRDCFSAWSMERGKEIFTTKFIKMNRKVKKGLCFG